MQVFVLVGLGFLLSHDRAWFMPVFALGHHTFAHNCWLFGPRDQMWSYWRLVKNDTMWQLLWLARSRSSAWTRWCDPAGRANNARGGCKTRSWGERVRMGEGWWVYTGSMWMWTRGVWRWMRGMWRWVLRSDCLYDTIGSVRPVTRLYLDGLILGAL